MQEAESDEPQRPTRTTWIVALTVALAGYLVWQFVPTSGALLDPEAQPRAILPRGDLTAAEKLVTQLFQGAAPSVVNVTSRATRQLALGVDGGGTDVIGLGTGFIWDSAGHVVTNYHVIHGAQELRVTLSNDETQYVAEVVGFEVEKDIAVLKVAAPQVTLAPIAVGSSSDLLVGQSVYAIGNPFGFGHTLTHGLISSVDRSMPARYAEQGRGQHYITGLIQTDAAINPGNSGGPLLDSAGRLIGMNTAIKSDTGENTGVGFAIPVDTINRIVTDILKYGQARRPGLGVKVMPERLNRGVIISEVVPGGGADRAGLKGAVTRRTEKGLELVSADLIVGVNGKPVRLTEDLFRELDRYQVGEKVHLKVMRGQQTLEVDVELQYLQ